MPLHDIFQRGVEKEEAQSCEWQVLRGFSHHGQFTLIFNESFDKGGCQSCFCGHLLPPTAVRVRGQMRVGRESVGGFRALSDSL